MSTNSTTEAKQEGSGNKHERQSRDHSAPNRRDTRTPAAPPASPTRVRGHSQPANPDRPQLTHQHREHPGANTQAPPAHTQRTIQCRHTPLRDSTRSRAVPPCRFRSPVGVAGLEPAASSSRTKRATKLRHTPKTGKQTSLFHYQVIVFLVGFNHSTRSVRLSKPQSRMWDSNPQHLVYKTSTLPVELIRRATLTHTIT